MSYPFLKKTALPLLMLLPALYAGAQRQEIHVRTFDYTPRIKFIVHAPVLVPELLAEGRWDQMRNFLENWKNSPAPSNELIFSLEALMNIESRNSTPAALPCDVLYYLDDYAKELKNSDVQAQKFRYYVRLDLRYSYDGTADARKILQFTRSWAIRLLTTRQLGVMELFLCRVFAGEIGNPSSYYMQNKIDYPAIAKIQNNIGAYNDWYFTDRRDRLTGTAGLMVGCWFPTGHLQLLGSHPSVGIQLGVRNKWNEYDLSWTFRFYHPTPKYYNFVRGDSLFTTNYYDGGYIGFEYTRYFLHKKYLDFGYTTGFGYDYFSVADGFGGANPDVSQLPLNVGAFNFNNGLRVKYFFHKKGFLGLTAKYNMFHYANQGGTDLSGNAFTVDLIYGSH